MKLFAKIYVRIILFWLTMYLTNAELRGVLSVLSERFESVSVLLDAYTNLGAKMSKIKNPVRSVGVTTVYGLDEPKSVENARLTFVRELDGTPQALIDELSGFERFVFKRLYAGRLSKKLYKLYEYER